MKPYRSVLICIILSLPVLLIAQHLKPGFDREECLELLKMSARHGDSSYYNKIPAPQRFKFVYRSPEMGLKSCWDLWISPDLVAVIDIRGTTKDAQSWLANFYSAMVPAKGELKLNDSTTFKYTLATDPKAAVHVGWLISMAYLSKDVLPRIDSCYKQGTRDIIITGHSQGGGVSFLMTAYLYSLQKQGILPSDIRFKTYCTAGPKPGNLFFAYEYEAMTGGVWAFNLVNTADWVPEVPFSIQTINDFSTTNPFVNAKEMIRKQKFPRNWALRHVYNKLSKPAIKAQKNYQAYLGEMVSKYVKKDLPGFTPPEYFESNCYVRTGTTILLVADEAYYKLFPDSLTNVFCHHLFEPYLYLTAKLPETR
jgi:hypothetical protein